MDWGHGADGSNFQLGAARLHWNKWPGHKGTHIIIPSRHLAHHSGICALPMPVWLLPRGWAGFSCILGFHVHEGKEYLTGRKCISGHGPVPPFRECSQHLRVLRSLVDAILGVIINAILWMEKWRKEEDGQKCFLLPSLNTEVMGGNTDNVTLNKVYRQQQKQKCYSWNNGLKRWLIELGFRHWNHMGGEDKLLRDALDVLWPPHGHHVTLIHKYEHTTHTPHSVNNLKMLLLKFSQAIQSFSFCDITALPLSNFGSQISQNKTKQNKHKTLKRVFVCFLFIYFYFLSFILHMSVLHAHLCAGRGP